MNKLKKFVALALVLCMILTVMPVYASAASEDFLRVYHVDCGRKFFDTADVEELIDLLSDSGYTHLELALGNNGLRLILDDMSVLTYDSDDVAAGIRAGNVAYAHAGEWSQAEMDAIIEYANERSIEIIPLINTPGHMNTILDAMESVGISGSYNGSATTVDVTNTGAVEFTKALVAKYAAYFASRGCTYFNMGADEYANDIYTDGAMGFGHLQSKGLYGKFADYVNDVAAIIKDAGMTPIAFNDGLYFAGDDTAFDTDIVAAYWTSGWGSYSVASAAALAGKGHKILNTNDGWYYVLGRASGTYGYSGASRAVVSTPVTDVPGSDDPAVIGAMACLWCDTPSVSYASYEENVSTLIETLADSNPGYFVAASSKDEPIATEPAETDPPADDKAPADEVIEERSITVLMGQTVTDVIEGADCSGTYSNEYVSVSAEYEYVEAGTETILGDQISVSNSYGWSDTGVIKSGDHYLVLDGSGLSATTDVSKATEFTVTRSGSNQYTIKSGSYFLSYSNSTVSASTSSYSWSYSSSYGFYRSSYNSRSYLTYSNGSWITSGSANSSNRTHLYEVDTVTTGAVDETTVTFTGLKVGTTIVTVGNVRYTVTVKPEDLTGVSGLQMEFWVTNRPVTPSDFDYSTTTQNNELRRVYATISAADAYGEKGVALSKLAPAAGMVGTDNGDQPAVFWMGRLLHYNSSETTNGWDYGHQNRGGGNDKTKVGDAVQSVRYYGGKWSVYTGTEWVDVDTGSNTRTANQMNDQLVVYYRQETTVTKEVTTYVVDWGPDYDDYGGNNAYVLLDFAVMYPSANERVPNSFPNTTEGSKTIAFHCVSGDPTVTADGTTRYRTLGEILGVGTVTHEIYMITLTPTSDNKNTKLSSSTASGNRSYTYSGTEKAVWVDDEMNLGKFAPESLRHEDFHVGGDPIVPRLKIYNQQGMLVTYYLRTKASETALTVHYMDRNAGDTQFHEYGIAVEEGTLFSKDMALDDPWKGPLVNGEVKNYYGNKETVSADLTKLTGIGAQYLYSEYTCVEVRVSEDQKHVYLYYEFKPEANFVVDFGLPVQIDAKTDLHDSLKDAEITAVECTSVYSRYGRIDVDGTSITYTPMRTIQGVDSFVIVVDTKDPTGILDATKTKVAFRVYIYPATTVYYDETFATLNGSWTVSGSVDSAQEVQKAGETGLNYGFTGAYDGAMRTDAVSIQTGDTAVFTFTGTGVEIYANSTTDSGVVTAVIYGKNTAGKEVIEKVYLVDTVAKDGIDPSTTGGQAQNSYGLPIISVAGLSHGTHRVELFHSGAGEKNVILDGFRVTDTLGDLDNDAFAASERDPAFVELRNAVLTALNIEISDVEPDDMVGVVSGQVFEALEDDLNGALVLSGNTGYDVADLLKNGPKNELFLRKGESVSFDLGSRRAQIGLKALNDAVTYTVNGKAGQIDTSVDMFYGSVTGMVTIVNTGDGILSVTKLKAFGADSADEALEPISEKLVTHALQMMGIIEKPEPVNPFVDVAEGSWYYDSVLWAVENGITTGADATHFLPDAICQRASVVTFLWRAAGSPEPESTVNPFVDVTEDAFFYKAVLWAVEKGITNGVDATHFAPFNSCSRAQVVTFLWRAKGSPAASAGNPFSDVAEGQWYTNAVLWAVKNGITNGMSSTLFGVESICNRAQIVTFLYRASTK
ncbi:MAG: hypothetical protein E7451_04435 [Ruminococcaceae bacterium]|nr:hypothetical protein [Oscillospiraceae bacterium]